MNRDEWSVFSGATVAALEAVREEWIANAAGFSWASIRPGNPVYGTPEWTAMRAAYFTLAARLPSVEAVLDDALSLGPASCSGA